ncbi:UPF0175 family protein [Haladaptatus cibarius]|uniref:UPF0175 family protein n=1 Tax=Haladaptatus cibarius TaxID=453847 RepID=UPI000679BC9F|nr:UPF0175 family protein [Haladaptatus cibarius]
MSQHHITTRVPDDLYEAIEMIQETERTDRSTAVKRLLERGVEEWRLDTAIRQYRDGELSLGKAAEVAGISYWRFLDVLESRGIEMNYDESDLESDFAAVRDE